MDNVIALPRPIRFRALWHFDITTGRALTLPAYEPVETYPVRIEDGWVRVDIAD